jgi:hypothetical protein
LPDSGTRSSKIFDPIHPARRAVAQRLALLDDLADEEMFWHNEQVYDRERFEIVVHEQKVGIVACGQTLALGFELSVQNLCAKFALLAL